MHMKEPDPDDCLDYKNMFEPDPDDSQVSESMKSMLYLGTHGMFLGSIIYGEPDPDDFGSNRAVINYGIVAEPDPDDAPAAENVKDATPEGLDPNDCNPKAPILEYENIMEPDPDDSLENDVVCAEPDPDDDVGISTFAGSFENLPIVECLSMQTTGEPDPDDKTDNASSTVDSVSCYPAAVDDYQVTPVEATSVLQTLVKIVGGMTSYPGEMEFRRLCEANPMNAAKCKVEVPSLVGIDKDIEWDGIGMAEIYADPGRNGFPWLSLSSMEAACTV
ncbi:uncharacterized protein LOC131228618 isoform X2 [Magnolia sinica]|uniref:uncharacterized protein LOC131228618 isoform X2 n=1 Tax=Magnolia sinica TaxID=86752 RepID=UPI002658C1FE|nr:uncharacterized protein LOC131228618 isoform X2 [Magnolia sinica]